MVMQSSPICLKLNKFVRLFIELTIDQSDISVHMSPDAWLLRASDVGTLQLHSTCTAASGLFGKDCVGQTTPVQI